MKNKKTIYALCAAALAVLAIFATSYTANVKSEQGDTAKPTGEVEQAIFAGGCFWCVESDFDKADGVLETISGYTGGHTENPTYKQVGTNRTGHYEAVKITYDPKKITYNELLDIFWYSVDPTDDGGQFCDRGLSYRTAIFAVSDQQRELAEASKNWQQTEGRQKGNIVTPILRAAKFYPAETYHQDYYKKNPLRYAYYRKGCGRDKQLRRIWGDKALSGIKKQKSS